MKVFRTSGVCAKEIGIKVENDVITEIKFFGGCDGNTQGLENLLVGMHKDEVVKRLEGVDCRGRGTSCPDQLAAALKQL